MTATYDVMLSVVCAYRVDGVRAESERDAKDIASAMWWNGEVERGCPQEVYLDDAYIAIVYDEGGDDEGDQEADSSIGADSLDTE